MGKRRSTKIDYTNGAFSKLVLSEQEYKAVYAHRARQELAVAEYERQSPGLKAQFVEGVLVTSPR